MPRVFSVIFVVATQAAFAAAADDPTPPGDRPQTRPERTDYRETSSLADVKSFLGHLSRPGGAISSRSIGTSAGGRDILLATAASEGSRTPEGARRAGKLIVYVQANIHGGEVEGKEAALMLLRDVAFRPDHPLLERLVLVVAPVFNPDGNEALGDGATQRPSQDGPDRVGSRPNAAGLDLNRDGMKAEAPATRAVLRHVYAAWNPDVVLDLHTTNGTRHGFPLTYSPPLHPATDPGVLHYTRELLLPSVRARLFRERGLRLFDYGNVEDRGAGPGWYTFGDEGRYVTNYAGLRGRVSVLSEAASFLPFRNRVETTLAFVVAVLETVSRDAERVRLLTRAADTRRAGRDDGPGDVPVRSEPASRGREPVPLEVVPDGAVIDHRKAPKALEDRTLPIYDRFHPTRTSSAPFAYLIPAAHSEVVSLLRRHGVSVGRLKEGWKGEASAFAVSEVVLGPSRFQAKRLTRLEGRFETRVTDVPAGTFVVPTGQPLGTLATILLEPESLDGVAAWGFLDGHLAASAKYPILKVPKPLAVATETVP